MLNYRKISTNISIICLKFKYLRTAVLVQRANPYEIMSFRHVDDRHARQWSCCRLREGELRGNRRWRTRPEAGRDGDLVEFVVQRGLSWSDPHSKRWSWRGRHTWAVPSSPGLPWPGLLVEMNEAAQILRETGQNQTQGAPSSSSSSSSSPSSPPSSSAAAAWWLARARADGELLWINRYKERRHLKLRSHV